MATPEQQALLDEADLSLKSNGVPSKTRAVDVKIFLKNIINTLFGNFYSKADTDSRFYSKTDTNALLAAKAPLIHTHEELASKQYTDDKIAAIVNSSPETLNTLNELATALGNDPNFATTISNQIGTKASQDYVDTQVKTKLWASDQPANYYLSAFSNGPEWVISSNNSSPVRTQRADLSNNLDSGRVFTNIAGLVYRNEAAQNKASIEYNNPNNRLEFYTNNGSWLNTMTLTTNNGGSVGVGTTGPLLPFQVEKNNGFGWAGLFRKDYTSAGVLLGSLDADSARLSSISADLGSEKSLVLNDGGGNVGIGITPTHQLTVKAGHKSIVIGQSTNSAGYSVVSVNGNTTTYGFEGILGGHNTDPGFYLQTMQNMYFRAGGNVERLVILSNGNVGIGDMSPATKLEVKAPLADHESATIAKFGGKSNWLNNTYEQVNIGFSYLRSIYNQGLSGWDFGIRTGQSDGNGTEALRVLANGRVGINTGTAAGSRLHVNGAGTGIVNVFRMGVSDSTPATRARMVMYASSEPNTDTNAGKVFLDGIRSATNMDFAISLNDIAAAAPVERFRILGNGNVGIGTVEPSLGLQVEKDNGNGWSALMRKNNTSSGIIIGSHDANSAKIAAIDPSLGGFSTLLLNHGGGNVGIGTTNVTHRLTVNGTAKFEGGPLYVTERLYAWDSVLNKYLGLYASSGVGRLTMTDASFIKIQENGGNVAVGDLTPSEKLHVSGNFLASGNITSQGNLVAGNGKLYTSVAGGSSSQRSTLDFSGTFVNSIDKGPRRTATIKSGFSTGVWGTEFLAFHVGWNGANANDAGNEPTERARIDSNGNFTASGDITAYSDAKLKDNVRPIVSPLAKVKALEGVSYNRNDQEGKEEIGFIAQQVKDVIPEIVKYHPATDLHSLDYGKLNAVLVEAIKELTIRLEKLEGGGMPSRL